jgi:hypothetical protein
MCAANALRFNKQRFLWEIESFVNGSEAVQSVPAASLGFNPPAVAGVWQRPGVKPYPYEQQ